MVVRRISAEFAPCKALASLIVWNGRYCSLEVPPTMLSSSCPPSVTILMPSEVLVVLRFPR